MLYANNSGGDVPAPAITAGPAWTDNTDGTATITWTTNVATDSIINYGYAADYLEFQATSATVTTSHSVTITDAAGTYHYQVTDTDADYTSTDDTSDITGGTPTTTNFTNVQAAEGFFGYFDMITQHSAVASRGFNVQYASWAFWVRGTAATLRCGGGATEPFGISVDDGAESFPTITGTNPNKVGTLFTSLSDGWHLVRIRANTGYGPTSAWTYEDGGTLISVTGGNPKIGARMLGGATLSKNVTDGAAPVQKLLATVPTTLSANTTPTHRLVTRDILASSNAKYSYGGTILIRAKCTDLWIYTGEPVARYAVDSGSFTQTTFPAALGAIRQWRRVATGLDGSAYHDYVIISGRASGTASTTLGPQGVMIGGFGAAFATPTTRRTVMQFGDSITLGQSEVTQYVGNGDAYIAAQAAGCMAFMCGVGGKTTAGLDTDLTSLTDGRWPVPDVAILAIGRNDVATAEATFKASYDSCIGKLLTFGAGKVLCRGIVPDQAGAFATPTSTHLNTWIKAVVDARADADVIYIEPLDWPNDGLNIETIESAPYSGTHPNDTGYVTLAGYQAAMYAAHVAA